MFKRLAPAPATDGRKALLGNDLGGVFRLPRSESPFSNAAASDLRHTPVDVELAARDEARVRRRQEERGRRDLLRGSENAQQGITLTTKFFISSGKRANVPLVTDGAGLNDVDPDVSSDLSSAVHVQREERSKRRLARGR